MEIKAEVNQEEAISFKKLGSSYVVSAPVNLGNYSVNFFHENIQYFGLGMEC